MFQGSLNAQWCSDVSEAQPFYSTNPVTVALAHNGTLTNSESMRDFLLETHFCQFNTGSDSEVLLNLFAFELSQINFDTLSNEHVFKALKKVYALQNLFLN